MPEEMIVNMIQQFPNFAGFVFTIVFLYRALMRTIEANAELTREIIACYQRHDIDRS